MTRCPPLNRRHIFLFDTAVIVCKRRGDNYEMKEVIDLHFFKITNNPTSDKENRKVCTRSHAVFHYFYCYFFFFMTLALSPPLPRRVTQQPRRGGFPHTADVLMT